MRNEISKNAPSLSTSDWQRYIDTWASSGEKQKTFCTRHQLSYIKFGYWRNKLKKKHSKNQGARFQPVQIKPKKPIHCKRVAPIEVILPNGIQMWIDHDVKEELLKVVLNVLSAGEC